MQNPNKDKLRDWEKAVEVAFSMHFKKDHHQNKLAVLKGIVRKALSSYQQDLIKRIEEIKESVQKQTGSFKYDDCYDDILTIIRDNLLGKD